MKSIRIGNDIRIEWPIVLSGDVSKLQDLDLTVEVRPSAKVVDWHNYIEQPTRGKHSVMMNGGIAFRPDIGDGKEHCHPHRPKPAVPYVKLPYHIEDNTLIAMWTADRQFAVGDYDIILYAHKNEGGQAVCDQYRFVRLVAHSAQADAPDDSGIEAVIAMQPVTLKLAGLSAYEVAVINGFNGTEEEWLDSLKKPAEDAAEQAKEELEQFKTDAKNVIDKNLSDLKEQEVAVIDAKEKALSEIETTKQDAIADFSAQRVTPEMLSESVRQLIENSGEKNITNLPDDEDLSTTGGDTPVLKFKDKTYNPSGFSGLATKILRKNILGSKNVLAQEMVSDANTIYEIRYDFDLNGATITVPDNCVLKFNGGSIDNGTLKGTGTMLEANLYQIFGENLVFSGTFNIDEVYAEWWGAKSYVHKQSNINTDTAFWDTPQEVAALPDCSSAFNKALDFCGKYAGGVVRALATMYKVENTITIPAETSLYTEESTYFIAYMNGDGKTIITHNPDNYKQFTTETLEEGPYALKNNQLIATESMAVAFKMNSRRSKFVGRGTIGLAKSTFTIGILLNGNSYDGVDMSFRPYIDVKTVGGNWGQKGVPGVAQILSEPPVDETLNETGDIIYAWDKTTKKLYRKSNGSTTWADQGVRTIEFFNTSVRIDVGGRDVRLINPYICFGDARGFRGLEVYVHDGGWFSISTFEGCISYKHGGFMYVFTDGAVVAQDWKKVQMQLDHMCEDCRLFYAIRGEYIQVGTESDLSVAGMPETWYAYYLGKGTDGITIPSIGNSPRFVLDLGVNNKYNIASVNINSDYQGAYANTYFNVLRGNNPQVIEVLKNASFLVKDITSVVPINKLDSAVDGLTSKDKKDVSYLFDGDPSTRETVIDIDSGVYGISMSLIETPETGTISTASIAPQWLEIDYYIYGSSTYNDEVYIVAGSKSSNSPLGWAYMRYNKKILKKTSAIGKVFIPLGKGGKNVNLAIVSTQATDKLKVDVYAVKYWINSYDRETFGSYNTYWLRKSALKFGEDVISPSNKLKLINFGDAKERSLEMYDTTKIVSYIVIRSIGRSDSKLVLSSILTGLAECEIIGYGNGTAFVTGSGQVMEQDKLTNDYIDVSIRQSNGEGVNYYYHRLQMTGIYSARIVFYGHAKDLEAIPKVELIGTGAFGSVLLDTEDISEYLKNKIAFIVDAIDSNGIGKTPLNIGYFKRIERLLLKSQFIVKGNISNLPYTATYISIQSCDTSELGYNTKPYMHIWNEEFTTLSINTECTSMTTDMVDALLIDLAWCVKATEGTRSVSLPKMKRTAASDDAVAALEELGFTVNVPLQAEE